MKTVPGIQLACLDTMGVDQHSIRAALEEQYLKLQMAVAVVHTAVITKNRYSKIIMLQLISINYYKYYYTQGSHHRILHHHCWVDHLRRIHGRLRLKMLRTSLREVPICRLHRGCHHHLWIDNEGGAFVSSCKRIIIDKISK